jgi:hypothetical protein
MSRALQPDPGAPHAYGESSPSAWCKTNARFAAMLSLLEIGTPVGADNGGLELPIGEEDLREVIAHPLASCAVPDAFPGRRTRSKS